MAGRLFREPFDRQAIGRVERERAMPEGRSAALRFKAAPVA
jgi:hypothetical protein